MYSSDLRFLHCGSDPGCTATVDKTFDDYYTLQFMEQGGGAVEVWYDDRCYTLNSESSAWFWPAFPGPRIRFHAAPGQAFWRHRYAAFQGSRVGSWIAHDLWPTLPQTMPSALYSGRFDDLLSLVKSAAPDPWRSARAANLLEAFLLELAEARMNDAPSPAAPAAWLTEVFAALRAAEPPDCPRLALQLGMAPSTLRRRFREAVGIPFHEYVLRQRIAKARTLLGDTELPIKAVAEQLGYQDVYFFTRQFRLRTGVTPAVYRRSRQG
jgi:AraC-like DNA-binding protein